MLCARSLTQACDLEQACQAGLLAAALLDRLGRWEAREAAAKGVLSLQRRLRLVRLAD
jgi:hypothetical protein